MLLQLYLDEKEIQPEVHTELSPNGFYAESCINDSPIREHRTVLHIRRRRWKDAEGKSYGKDWELTAKGTRHSKEFAAFFKEFLGYNPRLQQDHSRNHITSRLTSSNGHTRTSSAATGNGKNFHMPRNGLSSTRTSGFT